MKIEFFSAEPFEFVTIEYRGKKYWAIEFTRRFTEQVPAFHRYVICAPMFTVDQLLFIQRQAIERSAEEDVRHWIYQAIEERRTFIQEDRTAFYWDKHGALEVITYKDEEAGLQPKLVNTQNFKLSELGELAGIAIQQEEHQTVIDFLRQAAAEYVEQFQHHIS
jgi:hypothetical protein